VPGAVSQTLGNGGGGGGRGSVDRSGGSRDSGGYWIAPDVTAATFGAGGMTVVGFWAGAYTCPLLSST